MNRLSFTIIVLSVVGCDNAAPDGSLQPPAEPHAAPTAGPAVNNERQMATTFDSLYSDFVIASFDKQLRMADVHGDDSWGFDKTQGVITFGESVAYKIQILGTEDHVAETWMWGWANKASEIPEELLTVAHNLRSYGEEHSISQLTNAKASLADVDGHTVSLIASGFVDGRAYYRCPYENGALFVLITDPTLKLPVDDAAIRATRVIPECISALEILNHRRATEAYLRQTGFDVADNDGNVTGSSGGAAVVTVRFDKMNRLIEIKTHLEPENGT